jgi:hypothetical protein
MQPRKLARFTSVVGRKTRGRRAGEARRSGSLSQFFGGVEAEDRALLFFFWELLENGAGGLEDSVGALGKFDARVANDDVWRHPGYGATEFGEFCLRDRDLQ